MMLEYIPKGVLVDGTVQLRVTKSEAQGRLIVSDQGSSWIYGGVLGVAQRVDSVAVRTANDRRSLHLPRARAESCLTCREHHDDS